MNVPASPSSKPFRLDSKKIVVIAIILVVGGYQLYTENYSVDQSASTGNGLPGKVAGDEQSRPPTGNANNAGLKKSNVESNRETAGPFLLPAGAKNLKSPAGLIYTGGQREHRSDHVLRHASDIPNREGPHGVFDADGDDVFRLVDEAYQLVKSKSRQVKTTQASDGKQEHIIDMKRKIGFLGGRTGNRENHPPLYKVKLILAENRVITAYPY